jgi:hypothetical protein
VRSQHHRKHESKRSARARARERLTAEIRRNPKALLKPSFIRKAQLLDYSLPLTVRLNAAVGAGPTFAPSDDLLQIAGDPSTVPWPQPPDLAAGIRWGPPAPQTTTLTGGFRMQVHFSADTSGYGGLGVLETTQGQQVAMQGTPFGISDFDPTCAGGPSLRVRSATTVRFSAAGTTFGILNLASGTAAGVLHVYGDLSAERADACDPTANAYQPTPEDASTATPIVISYSGAFRLSPAITADGRLRFGKIAVDDAVSGQQASFSYLHACASATVTCNDTAFPVRVKLLKLTAELLVGDVPL